MVQELNKIKIFALNIWKQFIDVSIRIKLIGLTMLTSLFLGIIISYFMLSFYNGEISHDAQYMSMVIGRHISEASVNFITGGNYNKLNILLKNEVKNNKNILPKSRFRILIFPFKPKILLFKKFKPY